MPLNDTSPTSERVALSRDYSEFLIELSIALHKYGMYPSGHPSLRPAAAGVAARAAQLRVDRPQVAFGVARRQLIIEGIATNPNQPVLRRLAEGLHRHHLGAVTVTQGVDDIEVGDVLRALSQDPEQHGPIGLGGEGRRQVWPHVRLHPLSFDGLSLANDVPLAGLGNAQDGQGGRDGQGTRGGELWIGLARAALAGDAAPDSADAVDTEPSLVARAIDQHPRAVGYDQVIIGYLLQISRELKTGSGAEAAALQRRTARLIGSLSPPTLRRLIEMGGDVAQRRAFVLDASQSLAVDVVLEIVKAAAEASGQTISHGLVRMLSKLAAHAEFGDERARPIADAALREQVGQLVSGWQLDDPNPDAYSKVLQHLATTATVALPSSGDVATMDPLDPLRLVQMGLEIGDGGPMVGRALDDAIMQGRAADLLLLLSDRPEGTDSVAALICRRLVQPEVLRTLLDEPSSDILDRLQPLMLEDSWGVVLDALATADNRTTRRKLLDRLTQAPIDLGPIIVARLDDPRWFVQRNLLVLLERRGRIPKGFSLARWVSHPDVRVRREAIRLQLTLPDERHLAVRAALEDGHPRLVHSGLATLQQQCPGTLAELVGRLAADANASMDLRVLAVRALERCRDGRALPPLLALVHGGRTLLGRPKLAARTPVMLAALQALATGWRPDARASAMLKLAAGVSDPDIRQATQAQVS